MGQHGSAVGSAASQQEGPGLDHPMSAWVSSGSSGFLPQSKDMQDIFYRTDVSRTGNLSMNELRNALEAAGFGLNDHMLNLMALRYGGSTGEMSLESFICLILRMESMAKTFRKIAAGGEMHLGENEWMYLTMYS